MCGSLTEMVRENVDLSDVQLASALVNSIYSGTREFDGYDSSQEVIITGAVH